MSARTAAEYLTIPEELQAIADRLLQWFEDHGYNVKVEDRSRPEYPTLPCFVCRRGPTSLYVDLAGELPRAEHVREWEAFCRVQSADSRYVVAVRTSAVSMNRQLQLVADGIGLLAVDEHYDVHELNPAADKSIADDLPKLTKYPKEVRRILAPSWEEVGRGRLLEGFDDACVAFENEARKYLVRHAKSGRISFAGTTTPSPQKIGRMTMGQMIDAFSKIQRPNHADSVILQTLRDLNPDRIRVAHKRKDGRSLAALRQNAPGLMWKLGACMEHCLK